MRYVRATAVIVSLSLLPLASAAGTPSWQPAKALSVNAGAGHSDFIVQAYVALPKSCYAARIRSTPISLHAPRSFYVEQLASTETCANSTYKCTVVSAPFPLPIPHKIEVVSQGPQKWEVTVATHEPKPIPPMCRKG